MLLLPPSKKNAMPGIYLYSSQGSNKPKMSRAIWVWYYGIEGPQFFVAWYLNEPTFPRANWALGLNIFGSLPNFEGNYSLRTHLILTPDSSQLFSTSIFWYTTVHFNHHYTDSVSRKCLFTAEKCHHLRFFQIFVISLFYFILFFSDITRHTFWQRLDSSIVHPCTDTALGLSTVPTGLILVSIFLKQINCFL